MLRLTPPLLGTVATLRVEAAPPGASSGVILSFPPIAPLPLPGGCLAYLDPSSASVFGVLPAGSATLPLPIPAGTSWLGLSFAAQAVAWPASAPNAYVLSNALEFTLGVRQGPLAGLPSPAGPHLTAVQALAAGGWLDLGVPAADPFHGLATGREYTPRMAWAQSLQGAFLTGESGHGYVNPATGRYIDDVWFYDFAAHAWRCVRAGSEVAMLSLRLDANQFEVDARGDLVPVAQLGHGYELVAFDEWSQRFFMQPAPNTYWVPAMPQRLGWLPSALFPESQYRSPWLFDTVTGKWRRQPPGTPMPTFNVSARAMAVQAIPGSDRVWVFDTSSANRDRIWWFDPATSRWIDEPTASSAPPIIGNGVTCYDRSHHRVWYHGVHAVTQQAGVWYYDVGSRTWNDTNAVNTPPHTDVYLTGSRGLTYDEVAAVVLLRVLAGGGAPPSFHPFDVRTNAYGAAVAPPANLQPQFAWMQINAFYAPGHNVHVLHVSRTDSATGRIIVYRHAR
jgi:hypothetical protein